MFLEVLIMENNLLDKIFTPDIVYNNICFNSDLVKLLYYICKDDPKNKDFCDLSLKILIESSPIA